MSNLTTDYKKLKDHHSTPVDKLAVVVAFFKGEHYEPPNIKNKKIYAMYAPPPMQHRPENAEDYTGKRQGRMTAMYWFMNNSKSLKKSTWVCRCDCGMFQFRRPYKWDKQSFYENDMCDICKLNEEKQRQGTSTDRPDRLISWVKSMQEIGVSNIEIIKILVINFYIDKKQKKKGVGVQTKHKSLQDIKKQIDGYDVDINSCLKIN